eukprot:645997-Prorocentrum_minimum.AAC.5
MPRKFRKTTADDPARRATSPGDAVAIPAGELEAFQLPSFQNFWGVLRNASSFVDKLFFVNDVLTWRGLLYVEPVEVDHERRPSPPLQHGVALIVDGIARVRVRLLRRPSPTPSASTLDT